MPTVFKDVKKRCSSGTRYVARDERIEKRHKLQDDIEHVNEAASILMDIHNTSKSRSEKRRERELTKNVGVQMDDPLLAENLVLKEEI